ncbi:MAG TPA: hypothetical protein VGK48_18345 [Terriglobia bacterium]
MKAKRQRRAGATETVGVSLDPATKRMLKKLAAQKHQGNVSALIAEMAENAVRQSAFEKAWAWYGGPELTNEARDNIDAELEEGWRLARRLVAKKKRRRKAA